MARSARDRRAEYQARTRRAQALGFRNYYEIRRYRAVVREAFADNDIYLGRSGRAVDVVDRLGLLAKRATAPGGTGLSSDDLFSIVQELMIRAVPENEAITMGESEIWSVIRGFYPRSKGQR